MPFGTAMAAEALEEAACNLSLPLPVACDPCGDQGAEEEKVKAELEEPAVVEAAAEEEEEAAAVAWWSALCAEVDANSESAPDRDPPPLRKPLTPVSRPRKPLSAPYWAGAPPPCSAGRAAMRRWR